METLLSDGEVWREAPASRGALSSAHGWANTLISLLALLLACLSLSTSPTPPAEGSITVYSLADAAVSRRKLAPDAVGGAVVAAGGIGRRELASGAVGRRALAQASVGSLQLDVQCVHELNLADAAVTRRALAEGAVGAQSIARGAVSASHLAPTILSMLSQTVHNATSEGTRCAYQCSMRSRKVAPPLAFHTF